MNSLEALDFAIAELGRLRDRRQNRADALPAYSEDRLSILSSVRKYDTALEELTKLRERLPRFYGD